MRSSQSILVFINTVKCREVVPDDIEFERDEVRCVVQVCSVMSALGHHVLVTWWDPARSAHLEQHAATGMLLRPLTGSTIMNEGIQTVGVDPRAEIFT